MSEDRSMTPDQEARFDAALARAARGLVVEEMPRGILRPDLEAGPSGVGAVRGRRTVPGFAAAATIVVLLLAMGFVLLPGGGPSPSAAPSSSPSSSAGDTPTAGPSKPASTPQAFRTAADIRADFERLAYACAVGRPLATVGPGPDAAVREGLVCTAPDGAGPYMAAAIVSVTADDRPIELHVKADLTGADSPAVRDAVATPLAKAVAIVVPASGVSAGTGDALARWVLLQVPLLEPDTGTSTDLFGYTIKIFRATEARYELIALPSP